ncbi:MAG: iron-containing alcohol dehydrogenase [Pseudoruminococcus massiliensis]|jgi:alcohol dehydrogenase YqhD (iron-dependent ADH family)|uniref:iron-containing alcohol dehydrogenase n=1 Tax=Pseudoruminococcus massiliensis TaxID=2086583 RepID=UPI003994B565|nr:iron-containing alcohol dehydrogenase [Oscillospiraceae bacterium]
MNNFIFENKTKVYFGRGCAKEYLTYLLKQYGSNVMLAYGGGSIKKNGVYTELMEYLKAAGKMVTEFSGIMSNPTYAKVQEGARFAKDNHIDLIIAVGGGSVIDCCKIISAQAKTDEDIWKMEFEHHTYPSGFVPMIAIVTASGTGAEMNNGAVITNEEKKIKAGLLGAQADIAMLDPDYTMSLPMTQVISGAFDTLSHCMETYFGKPEENNLSDDMNEAIMRSVIRNMRVLLDDSQNYEARSELMWASAMGENSILKIGKITDFQAHQIEHQLGAYTDCNHGRGLAVIHPVLYRHIYKEGLSRFARFGRNVWGADGTDEETALAGINNLADFIKEMGLPTTFREMGITDTQCFQAVADSTNVTAGCCKKLSHEEIYQILMEAF